MGEFSEIHNSLNIRESKWAHFDTTDFPRVKVNMKGVIDSPEEYDNFIHNWKQLYKRNTVFTLHFDTSEVGMVSMKYAFKMRSFIRDLKSNHPKLLTKSYIKVNSKWTRFLLKIMFFMEKPVADVYIYQDGIEGYSIVMAQK